MRYSEDKTARSLETLNQNELNTLIADGGYAADSAFGVMLNFYKSNKDNYIVQRADEDTEADILRSAKNVNRSAVVKGTEREKRAQLRDELSHKMWDYQLRSALYDMKYKGQHRTFLGLYDRELTSEASLANERFARIMSSGTPEEKKREVGRRIEEIGNLDLSFIDLNNDESFVKNYEKYCQIKMWADTQNIVRFAKEAGVDLTEPRYKKYCEKAPLLSTVWMAIGSKEKIITGPAYDCVDFSKLTYEQTRELDGNAELGTAFTSSAMAHGINVSEANGKGFLKLFDESLAPQQRLDEAMKLENKTSELYLQSAAVPAAAPEANDHRGFIDSPDGFFAKMDREYRHRFAEMPKDDIRHTGPSQVAKSVIAYRMQREYTETVRENGALDTETFYFRYNSEKIDDMSTQLLKVPGVPEALSTLTNEDRELLACGDKDALRSLDERIAAAAAENERRRRENPHDYYKEKILKNIEEIHKVDNSFTMTDEEVEAMITPEELEKHRRAAELSENVERNMKSLSDDAYGTTLPAFSRIACFLEKRDGEPNAAEDNKKMLRKFVETTPEGDAFRRQSVVDILNRCNTLSSDTLIQMNEEAHRQYEEQLQQPKAPGEAVKDERYFLDKAIFEYAMENYETAKLAVDIKNIDNCLPTSGFTMSEEGKQKLAGQHSHLVGLGTIYAGTIKRYASEDGFTFPVHKISQPLMEKLLSSGKKVAQDVIFCAENNSHEKYLRDALTGKDAGHSREQYSEEDILPTGRADERSVSSIADLRRTYSKFYKELKDADHFYNSKNSTEYTDVLTSLEKADKLLKGLEGKVVPTDLRQALYETVIDVSEKATAYKKKKQREEVRENRTKRIEICGRINEYSKKIFNDHNHFNNADNRYYLDKTFLSFTRTVQDTVEKQAQAERDAYIEERNSVRVDAKTARREELFRSGLAKTEAEREKINAFRRGTNARKAQIKAVKARNELTDLVGRKDITAEKARALMATVVCCEKIAKRDPNARDMSHEEIDGEIAGLYADKNFTKLAGKPNSDEINAFLSENGSSLFAERLDALRQPEQNRQREAAAQAEEPSLK